MFYLHKVLTFIRYTSYDTFDLPYFSFLELGQLLTLLIKRYKHALFAA